MAAIHELGARELAAAYAGGELSPVEATRASLARIDAWEPKLNAMYRVLRDAALDEARAAEARWRAGRPRSPLDGVPVTLKENIYTRGDPAPIGTRANEDTPPQQHDAPPAAQAAAAPELDPDVLRSRRQGLRVMPCRLDTPEESMP